MRGFYFYHISTSQNIYTSISSNGWAAWWRIRSPEPGSALWALNRGSIQEHSETGLLIVIPLCPFSWTAHLWVSASCSPAAQ